MKYFCLIFLFFIQIFSFCAQNDNELIPLDWQKWSLYLNPKEWRCIPPTQFTMQTRGTLWQNRESGKIIAAGKEIKDTCRPPSSRGEVIEAGKEREGAVSIDQYRSVISYDFSSLYVVTLSTSKPDNPRYEESMKQVDRFLSYYVLDEGWEAEKFGIRAQFFFCDFQQVSTASDHSSIIWGNLDRVMVCHPKKMNKGVKFNDVEKKFPFTNPKLILKHVESKTFFSSSQEGELYQLQEEKENFVILRKFVVPNIRYFSINNTGKNNSQAVVSVVKNDEKFALCVIDSAINSIPTYDDGCQKAEIPFFNPETGKINLFLIGSAPREINQDSKDLKTKNENEISLNQKQSKEQPKKEIVTHKKEEFLNPSSSSSPSPGRPIVEQKNLFVSKNLRSSLFYSGIFLLILVLLYTQMGLHN
jgi:hypothetical protein